MPVKWTFWTASHGLEPTNFKKERYLSEYLRNMFFNHPKFALEPIEAKGGGELDNEIIQRIYDKAISDVGQPQVHVILLGNSRKILLLRFHILIFPISSPGDNNLRNLNQTQEEYLDLIKTLYKKLEPLNKTHLVLTSILPSPRTNFKCKFVFRDVSMAIKNYVGHDNINASFMNLNGKFLVQGKPKNSLYLDRIHLNKEGAKTLAICIKNHLEKLPNITWK